MVNNVKLILPSPLLEGQLLSALTECHYVDQDWKVIVMGPAEGVAISLNCRLHRMMFQNNKPVAWYNSIWSQLILKWEGNDTTRNWCCFDNESIHSWGHSRSMVHTHHTVTESYFCGCITGICLMSCLYCLFVSFNTDKL